MKKKTVLVAIVSFIALLFGGCQEKSSPVVNAGNIEIKAYFSPRGGCTAAIVRNIDHAKKFVDVAIYSFTSRKIADALIRAYRRGVRIRVVADEGASRGRRCVVPLLEKFGIPVRYKRGSGGGLMHNKYAVIDGKIVITGSFNWTKSAEYRNDENLVVIRSSDLARVYEKNFKKLWKLAGLEN